ncbi:glycosyl hydrolase family 8 [Clostridium sp. SHJSY1]|uniref:glycosyl hydrolase family 8 n=1 Tax=Clostridium sp. SHJSY1 TaxID=2942483 RepID=UPI0028766B0C|nr:glycosyl hydrolase family 8 [Clostridium sp. SHJSY1]MDS0526181.1 glycosyl hydrolase family 8 [Clostridium sp. SHJSY1]
MIKKNRIILGISTIILVGIVTVHLSMPYIKPIDSKVKWENNAVSDKEQSLLNFVNSKLINENYGIKTNYKEANSEGEITKGASVLSESQGLMLLYYIDRDRKGEFDEILSYVKNNMILKNGLISWRVENGAPNSTSATIDDLRMVKALLLASERWNDINYRKLAFKISKGIKRELIDNELLADFNDGYGQSSKTTLCYLDLKTFQILANLDKEYKPIYKASLEVMNNGYISDKVPLYKKEYDRKSNSYDDGDVDTLTNSIVLLNRAQAGEDIKMSIDWLKEHYKTDGGIYASYNKDSGMPTSKVESTSIYSNLLQVSDEINDEELYDICKSKLEGYQVIDKNNLIYGAYGDSVSFEVYSFDNLNALLAWRKVHSIT